MSFLNKSLSAQALILKRSSVGEADRIVTLLTREEGKIAVVVKGVRKMQSSRRAFLEPGNVVKVLLIKTKSLPILTQASLLGDTATIRGSLGKMRQLTQLLEIVDRLLVEEELDNEVFLTILKIRGKILLGGGGLKTDLSTLISLLGYQNLNETQHLSILDYVSELTGQKMRSFEFLRP